jgi:uncharacterized protein
MPLLVDGHNLIGQIPSLKLSDADDEGKLVMLLRRYSTAKRSRQVVVVFDQGVYGHPLKLDGYGITCHFARSPQDADAQLIKRLRALKRPRDWMLVTSDRQVVRVAEERGVKVMSSQDFARQLLAAPARANAPPMEKPDVQLSEAEIAEWMEIFQNRPDKK